MFIFIVATALLSYTNVYAGQGNIGGGGNETGEWEIVWAESIDGENVSSKKLEKDDLIVIKVVAKARKTETYYRTAG